MDKKSYRRFIKSPFVLRLDKNLNKISRHFYKTRTTAHNPRLFKSHNNQTLLSYYQGTNLDSQAEKSEILFLDENYEIEDQIFFGDRLRIQELSIINNKLIDFAYNRYLTAIQFNSISEEEKTSTFAVTSDPTIPTDLELDPYGDLFFSGIANGFHYPDGYNYEQKYAFGFIAKMNANQEVTKQASKKTKQHIFFEDIELMDSTLLVTGTEQSETSSMDLLLMKYDQNLDSIASQIIIEQGIQTGVKSIVFNGYIYTLVYAEDIEDHSMKVRLVKSTKDLKTIWMKDYGDGASYKPTDLLITNNRIHIVSNIKDRITEDSRASLFVISLDGDLITQKELAW